MKRPLAVIILLLGLQDRSRAMMVVVPNALADVEGNTSQISPFGALVVGNSMRYQQVYDASQFAAVRPEGEFITALYFRLDSVGGRPFTVILPNVMFSLSTTLKGPDNLSSNFAENVGPDAMVVFRGRFESVGSYCPFCSPQGFQMGIIANNWFFYRPAAGNLLLDVQVYTYSNSLPAAPLDASDVLGDSLSTLASTNVVSSAGRPSTQGLVTEFANWSPDLQILQTNGMVMLYWWQGTEGFVLQTTTNVGSTTTWTAVTDPIIRDGMNRRAFLPIQTNLVASHYRLMWSPPGGKSLLPDPAEAFPSP
jgi:hypothetical protein